MKALHLTGYFFPEYSGTTTRLYNIVSRLPFEVEIIASDRTGNGEVITKKEEEFGSIKVKRIPLASGELIQSIPVLRYAQMLYRRPLVLTRFALEERFDIIHAHNSLTFGQAAARLNRKLRRRFILEIHGLSQENSTGVLGNIKAAYLEQVDRKVSRECDHIVTLTESLKKWLVSHYGLPEGKITAVPNGADIEQFSPGDEHRLKAEELRRRLGINGRVVMYAGNMDRINGVEDMARVIPQIIGERRDICFVFVGNRPTDRKVAALFTEYPQNVKFLPSVTHAEMPAYYQMCDVFVIPRPSTVSSETIVPLKLLEVMAMGKPVLGSNVGGITEVVKDGENGYLFQKGSLESFHKRLLEVVDTDNSQIGRNARRTVVENYTWDRSVRTLQKVYQDTI